MYKLAKYLTLNKITIGDSSPSDNKVQHNTTEQPDPDLENITSFRTVHSNFAQVGHSTKLPGHTTVKTISHKQSKTLWYKTNQQHRTQVQHIPNIQNISPFKWHP